MGRGGTRPSLHGPAWFFPVVGTLLVGELLWFGYGRNAQCDPALYYPSIPALEQVAKAGPGRFIGNGCLPAALSAVCGLRDVRGYDSIDPARMIELVNTSSRANALYPAVRGNAMAGAQGHPEPDGTVRLPPVLDLLGVRYVIYRGEPPAGTRPVFQSPDYWVLENRAALPRAFVPRRVEVVADGKVRLAKLASPEFAPREVAYIERPVTLPDSCEGTVEIVEELPTRVRASIRMATPGLVVLADQWDTGWRAWLNGKRGADPARGPCVARGGGARRERHAGVPL